MSLARNFLKAPYATILYALGASLLVTSAMAGCSGSDVTNKAVTASVAEGCAINTDCSSPLVCAFKRCHVACETTRDCAPGQRCMASDKPFHVCQLANERSCAYNSDCPGGQVCAVDGQCRDMCAASRDCVSGQVCAQGTCAEPVELTNDGGLPVAVDAGSDASGQPCLYNSECQDPLICRGGLCAYECLTARDCALGQQCLASRCQGAPVTPGIDSGLDAGVDSGADASMPGDSGAPGCVYNSDCAAGQICSSGACRCQCRTNVDCSQGELCDGCGCQLSVPPGAPPGYGAPCALSSECQSNLLCGSSGRCVWQCQVSSDCAPGFCCSASHACITGQGVCSDGGAGDAGSADAGSGAACKADFDCQDGKVCNGYERCIAGHCQAGQPACDDGNPCTADSCSEPGSCTHSSSPLGDLDQDGHFDVACGGGADDCDDSNPNVYAGHPEICDGIDNNCDGRADEGMWNAGPIQALAGQSTVQYGVFDYGVSGWPYQLGAPQIVRLADGTFIIAIAHALPGTGAPAALNLWQLDQNLGPKDGPTEILTANAVLGVSLATDGTSFLASVLQQTSLNTAAFAVGTSIQGMTAHQVASGTGPNFGAGGVFTSRAAVGYSAGRYVLAWADRHADGATFLSYVDTATVTGALGAARTVLADPTLSTAVNYQNPGFNVQMAVGSDNILVGWTTALDHSGAPSNIRTVLYAKDLSSTVSPIVDRAGTGWLNDAVHTGKSYILVSNDDENKTNLVTLERYDDVSGQPVYGGVTFQKTQPISDTRLAAINGGVMIMYSQGASLRFGWAPEDIHKGIAWGEILEGAPVTSADLAVIDAKTAVLVWSNGSTLRVSKLTCGG